MYYVKSNTIKDLTPDPGFDLDIPFIIMLIEESKTGRLVFCKVGKGIASILLNKFFDCLGCVEEIAI